MKKRYKYVVGLTVILIITACRNSVKNDTVALFEENPVTIKWSNKKNGNIESFQANVQIHSMNNRTDTHSALRETYRLSIKTIGERIYTRLDFPADEEYGILARSVLSDGENLIIFNPQTEEIEQRMVLTDESDMHLNFIKNETSLTRINLNTVRSEAARLAFDIDEQPETGLLVLKLPPSLFSTNKYEQLISARISFDIYDETLYEVETVYLREDGTKVTSCTQTLYEEKDGTPIKIGTVTEIDAENPNKIEGIGEDIPVYESIDEIPEISAERLAELKQTDSISEKNDIIFGDPGDFSYKETVVELYQDV